MRIAIASDHAGFQLKTSISAYLRSKGHDVQDHGTTSEAPVDYPPFCASAARAVVRGDAERAIVLGGSGQGEQITANKVHGIRAALCNELWTARMCRLHNDANVLAMGARIVTPPMANEIVDIFLTTTFEGGRHQPRLDQIAAIEEEECRG
jgi:ribose 5-phosphate isomerase B